MSNDLKIINEDKYLQAKAMIKAAKKNDREMFASVADCDDDEVDAHMLLTKILNIIFSNARYLMISGLIVSFIEKVSDTKDEAIDIITVIKRLYPKQFNGNYKLLE